MTRTGLKKGCVHSDLKFYAKHLFVSVLSFLSTQSSSNTIPPILARNGRGWVMSVRAPHVGPCAEGTLQQVKSSSTDRIQAVTLHNHFPLPPVIYNEVSYSFNSFVMLLTVNGNTLNVGRKIRVRGMTIKLGSCIHKTQVSCLGTLSPTS